MRIVLLVVGLLLQPASAFAQDNCKEILTSGIWDYSLNIDDTHNVRAFLNWYGSTQS
jgi:hypothetical protein